MDNQTSRQPNQRALPDARYRGWRWWSIALGVLSIMAAIGIFSQPQDGESWVSYIANGGFVRALPAIIGGFIGISIVPGTATLCAVMYTRQTLGDGKVWLAVCCITWAALVFSQAS